MLSKNYQAHRKLLRSKTDPLSLSSQTADRIMSEPQYMCMFIALFYWHTDAWFPGYINQSNKRHSLVNLHWTYFLQHIYPCTLFSNDDTFEQQHPVSFACSAFYPQLQKTVSYPSVHKFVDQTWGSPAQFSLLPVPLEHSATNMHELCLKITQQILLIHVVWRNLTKWRKIYWKQYLRDVLWIPCYFTV